jgi:steroid delta-isomerase-like uncharacterized protein
MRRQNAFTVALVFMLLAPLLMAGAPARAQDATSATECPATTPEENEALVRAYYDAVWFGRQFEEADRFLADDYAIISQGRPHANALGNADEIDRFREWFTDFPDLEVTIDDLIAAEDKVVLRKTFHGRQEDPLDHLGAPATRREATWTIITIFRVSCGEIAEVWIAQDDLSMLRHLGIISDEELATADEPTVATPVP